MEVWISDLDRKTRKRSRYEGENGGMKEDGNRVLNHVLGLGVLFVRVGQGSHV